MVIKIMVVFGTRPEAIKMAPLVLRLREDDRFLPIVVVTAQHREMLDQVLGVFAIEPDHDLDLQRDRQTLSGITVGALVGLEGLVVAEQPDLVVVQGDTTTAFAAALSAFYQQKMVVHLEAGLRTYDRLSPYPEETNRRLISALASLHLAPTPRSRDNLRREGIPETEIVCTGNTVIDALELAVALPGPCRDESLSDLENDARRVILVTTHRRESWGPPMAAAARAVARLAEDAGLRIVVPLHLNPQVREVFLPLVAGLNNVTVSPPLPYGAFAHVMARCDLVITDSGGIQEEAPSLGKPVLVLRDITERPEAIDAGTVELVGTDEELIVKRARRLLGDQAAYDSMARAVNPYGDGHAAGRAVGAIAWKCGLGERPEDFAPVLSPIK